MSPLKKLDETLELNRKLLKIKKCSWDVSYLREAKTRDSNAADNTTTTRNIIIEEKDLTSIERGVHMYP